jgi:fructose-bisphosphate aldolase class II
MWDGSTVPLKENLDIAEELLAKSQAAHTVLEIEIGAVGGEEDGHSAEINDKLYSSPADGLEVARRLGLGERGRYMAAFTFGNVHGAYKPGVVKLRPALLGEIQARVARAVAEGELASAAGMVGFPNGKPFELVFHGGSGSSSQEIAEAVSCGVIKMNVDTDTQYSFTRPIADHVFENYDKVLKIDGEVGEKKFYDPRAWGRKAEDSMSARVTEACKQLGSAGKALK